MNDDGEIGIAIFGTGFMAEAHSRAFLQLRSSRGTKGPTPHLAAVAGERGRASKLAARVGFDEVAEDWRSLIENDRVALFDNASSNYQHAQPTIAAAASGKHLFCEKPLAISAAEAYQMWCAAEEAGVIHMCGFNYRFVPAIRLARQIIRTDGIGHVFNVRCRYLASWALDQDIPLVWRLNASQAGYGALGDIGSHILDLARYLVGEVAAVSGATRTFLSQRSGNTVEVDDAATAVLEFDSGAIGSFEVSRVCPGHYNSLVIEVNGSAGSLLFDMDDLNVLQYASLKDGRHLSSAGFRKIRVTGDEHPFSDLRWPYGLDIGWGDTFLFEMDHLMRAVGGCGTIAPDGATFEDGYRVAEICDAIARSAQSSRREAVQMRALPTTPRLG